MRVFSHFAVDSLANSYIVGRRNGEEAFVVDPAVFDEAMLETIEGNGYAISAVLLTHCDERDLGGLLTILRVYGAITIYARVPRVLDMPAVQVEHGDEMDIARMTVQAIALPGHSRDSVAYRVNGFAFTGSALTAGETGLVPNPYAKAILLHNVQERILSLPDETVLFPFYGPPTTVGVERCSLPLDHPIETGEAS